MNYAEALSQIAGAQSAAEAECKVKSAMETLGFCLWNHTLIPSAYIAPTPCYLCVQSPCPLWDDTADTCKLRRWQP